MKNVKALREACSQKQGSFERNDENNERRMFITILKPLFLSQNGHKKQLKKNNKYEFNFSNTFSVNFHLTRVGADAFHFLFAGLKPFLFLINLPGHLADESFLKIEI